jgi:hypothetical protein
LVSIIPMLPMYLGVLPDQFWVFMVLSAVLQKYADLTVVGALLVVEDVVIQNIEGAAGLVGAKYVGEVAPRDGTLAGYLTATAFLYALDPELFRVDFKTYEFIGIQPGTSINFVRTDVPPGMKEPADFMKARGVILGSLAPNSSKGLRLRLGFDLLGHDFEFSGQVLELVSGG